MKKSISAITVLAIIILIASTFIEKIHGTAFAAAHIYHAYWFVALWVILGLLLLFFLIREKTYRHIPTLLSSLSIMLIIAGLSVTTFTAKSGKLTLKENTPSNQFVTTDSCHLTLPFSVELSDFQILFYPGTRTPQDFVSHVSFNDGNGNVTPAEISMNHIGRHQGYRFYQSGYDRTGQVNLTVTHDPWGIGLTYGGYILFAISFLLIMFDKRGSFRDLLRKIPARATVLISLVFISLFGLSAQAAPDAKQPRTLPKESAAKMGKINVLYNERICPLQTLAKDFTTKLYGAPTYKGLTSEQVLSGWIFYFNDWSKEPVFKIKGEQVRSTLGIKGKYASFTDYVDDIGQYRLEAALDTMDFQNPDRRNFLSADEKYNLIVMLYSGELMKIFPIPDSTGNLLWCSQSDPLPLSISEQEYAFIRYYLNYSYELVFKQDFATLDTLWEKTVVYQERNAGDALPGRVKSTMERLYNKMAVGRPMAMVCILIGLIFFAYAIACLGTRRTYARSIKTIGIVLLSLLSCYLAFIFGLRWYVAGHIPMGNGYETMTFMALCTAICGLIGSHRHPLFVSGGLLLTGFSLLVAMMGGANPSVTHLMPVLDSPLLCIHVAVIMTSYALLAFIMLNGLAALGVTGGAKMLKRELPTGMAENLSTVSQLLLYPAVYLLALGIIFGAVWANVSWGTYWSWDPKEVWALITLLVYLIPMRSTYFTDANHPMRFHLYTTLAFLSVLFTYFGVNFILGGMHSYA